MMKSLKWVGYGLLITGLTLAVISAFVPLSPGGSSAIADASTWRTVAAWHGEGSRSTPAFTVEGPWKIEWRTRPGRLGAGPFRIFIHDAAGDIVGVAADVTGQAQSQRVLRRSGTYYLEIVGAQPYTVTVQEKA
jgi:hypothetical protein